MKQEINVSLFNIYDMKEFIKRSGIIFIVIGVLVLSYAELAKLNNNVFLLVSAVLIMGGFVIYIVLNNIMD
ncbi:MAG: hypothetical protein DRI73_07255 [Bacteroidetes bacterium]|nr:MAG: hypothetical protein DRI73_07255 [Bacteroidota bacterium]